jgi:hypothetical protein
MATEIDLDSFEQKIGLPPNTLDNIDEYKTYLSMNITQLDKLDIRDCANISYRLSQFSLYIQRSLNREKAKCKIIKNKINKIIAPNINQYSGSWDLQRVSAIMDNDVSESLNEEFIESEAKQESLEYISSAIKELANHMKNLQFAKRSHE